MVDAAPDSSVALEARYRMARIHEAKGRAEEAMALYEAASQANSGDIAARSRFRLGEIHEGRGEFEEAARSFMQVAILYLHEELSSKALLRAGAAYEQAGNTAPARKAYEEVLRDFAESPEAAPAQEALTRLNGG